MENSIEEFVTETSTPQGENKSRVAHVKDEKETWVEGFICYNLVLYIKAYGLDALKTCKVCNKIFCHKGKYALYCSEGCKSQKNSTKRA